VPASFGGDSVCADSQMYFFRISDEGHTHRQKSDLYLDSSFFRISAEGHKGPRPRRISEPSADEEDLALLTPEERVRRKSFEQKRKAHYNEFYAVKMARQLMQEQGEPEEDPEADHDNQHKTTATAASSSSSSTAATISPMDTSPQS
jgi:hypothetical protein